MGLLYYLAREMEEKFPLIANGDCTINQSLRSLAPRDEAGQWSRFVGTGTRQSSGALA